MPLAPLTTLGVGGPARFFVEAAGEDVLIEALNYASARGLEAFILGGGSNILVSDRGFDGLVIRVASKGIAAHDPGPAAGKVLIIAHAGEDWDGFVDHCVSGDLAGVECLSGIPGLVGGTPVQNVGAYGQDVSESIVSVRCFDRREKELVELSNADCGFAYRKSIFNSTERDRYVVLSVTFRLERGGAPKIVYKDLLEHFGDSAPTLPETRDAVLRIRSAKSMVIDPSDPNSKSAGSFFKNPIVDRQKLSEIAETLSVESVPHFEAGAGLVKIPAAWLIERAGFYKGFSMGNAGISTKHSLALVNRGGAAAADLMALKNSIVETVFGRFAIELVPEPIFVGFD